MRRGRKRPKDENEIHWLGEGVGGQSSLFAELDPYLYRADAELCQIAKSMRYERSGDRQPMRILLCPPSDAIGWQMAGLREFGLVWVRHSEVDDFQEEIADRFGVEVLGTEIDPGFESSIDLIVWTDYAWESLSSFREGVRSAKQLLSSDGIVCFLLPGRISGADACVVWPDGYETELSRILAGDIFLLPHPRRGVVLPFADVSLGDDEFLRRFLRRHRTYFGKAALGAGLERMRDPDFAEQLAGAGSQLRCSILVMFGSDGIIAEKAA